MKRLADHGTGTVLRADLPGRPDRAAVGAMTPKKNPGPSNKDKELYEKLRNGGNSKQKAGRGSRTPRQDPSERRSPRMAAGGDVRRLDADQAPPQGQANRRQGPLGDVEVG